MTVSNDPSLPPKKKILLECVDCGVSIRWGTMCVKCFNEAVDRLPPDVVSLIRYGEDE